MSAVFAGRLSLIVTFAFLGLTACNRSQNQAASGNPANGNLAPASEASEAAPESNVPTSGNSYSQPEASQPASYEQTVEAPDPPPELPEYSQPPSPDGDYIWTPGYWAYADGGYYWVPGAWVLAPWVGALWTPPWWGYEDGVYLWHAGYWGPHIGFYGGVDYGFGYTGRGYYGAYWNDGRVYYNRAVTNVSPNVSRYVYNSAIPSGRRNHVSYNGGRGGLDVRPTAQELAVARDPRAPAMAAQIQHAREASSNRAQFAAAGHAQPGALVASRPLSTGYKAPAARPPATAMRAATRPPPEARAPATPAQRPVTRAARPEPLENRAEPKPAERAEPPSHPGPRPSIAEKSRTPMPPPARRPETTARPEARPPAPERSRATVQHPEARQQAAHGPTPEPRPAPPEARSAPSRPAAQARSTAQARPAPKEKRKEQ